MNWTIVFIVSLTIFIASIVCSVLLSQIKYKRGRIVNSLNVLFIGTFLTSFVIFYPIYRQAFDEGFIGSIESIFFTFVESLKIFLVDGEYSFILENVSSLNSENAKGIILLSAVLYFICPILSFGIVLSFFRNLSAYTGYVFGFFKNTYIFSELNEKSIELARSLKSNNYKRMIVFTSVKENNDNGKSSDLLESAKELGCIFFKKDINNINFSFHYFASELVFFAIGMDDSANLRHTLALVEKYRNRENTSLYTFSKQADSQLLLNQLDKGKIKLRRINESRSLVNRILYEYGEDIFKSASELPDGIKEISAVVIGMGAAGTQMVKALSWFCQMHRFTVRINAFDCSQDAKSEFRALCPDLLDDRYNGKPYTDADANYDITVHSGINTNTITFEEIIGELGNVTYVFVALGDDNENVRTAVNLRKIFGRIGITPIIQTIVYNSDSCNVLKGVTNFKGVPYNIDFIGDLRTSYSEEVVLNSEIEELARLRHVSYTWEGQDKEKHIDDFWRYEYNYMSSLASALHTVMKKKCNVPGIHKAVSERTPEELDICRRVEHRRWNAYMRSEGYRYSDKRNDMAKLHNCLVSFDDLPEDQKIKDDD